MVRPHLYVSSPAGGHHRLTCVQQLAVVCRSAGADAGCVVIAAKDDGAQSHRRLRVLSNRQHLSEPVQRCPEVIRVRLGGVLAAQRAAGINQGYCCFCETGSGPYLGSKTQQRRGAARQSSVTYCNVRLMRGAREPACRSPEIQQRFGALAHGDKAQRGPGTPAALPRPAARCFEHGFQDRPHLRGSLYLRWLIEVQCRCRL